MQQTVSTDPSRIVLEAIARRICVEAIYNGGTVRLAPHILYSRHDDLFIDAVTVARDGRTPRERKLGTFKLLGLRALALAGEPFDPLPDFEPQDPKYDGTGLFAVELARA